MISLIIGLLIWFLIVSLAYIYYIKLELRTTKLSLERAMEWAKAEKSVADTANELCEIYREYHRLDEDGNDKIVSFSKGVPDASSD